MSKSKKCFHVNRTKRLEKSFRRCLFFVETLIESWLLFDLHEIHMCSNKFFAVFTKHLTLLNLVWLFWGCLML